MGLFAQITGGNRSTATPPSSGSAALGGTMQVNTVLLGPAKAGSAVATPDAVVSAIGGSRNQAFPSLSSRVAPVTEKLVKVATSKGWFGIHVIYAQAFGRVAMSALLDAIHGIYVQALGQAAMSALLAAIRVLPASAVGKASSNSILGLYARIHGAVAAAASTVGGMVRAKPIQSVAIQATGTLGVVMARGRLFYDSIVAQASVATSALWRQVTLSDSSSNNITDSSGNTILTVVT
jgi:hypothetical protein